MRFDSCRIFELPAFAFDLLRRPEAEATEDRQRRAPALDGMLKEEAGDDDRYDGEATVDGQR